MCNKVLLLLINDYEINRKNAISFPLCIVRVLEHKYRYVVINV
jgi:hypothetical protein